MNCCCTVCVWASACSDFEASIGAARQMPSLQNLRPAPGRGVGEDLLRADLPITVLTNRFPVHRQSAIEIVAADGMADDGMAAAGDQFEGVGMAGSRVRGIIDWPNPSVSVGLHDLDEER